MNPLSRSAVLALISIIVVATPFAAAADCSDGVDNDADHLRDFPEDPGCTGPTDTSESGTSDWEQMCTGAHVVKCVGFEDSTWVAARYIRGDNPALCSGGQCWRIDTAQRASGQSSLRLETASASSSGATGDVFVDFADDFSRTFGAGETFYVQWRQRFDTNLLDTMFAGDQYGGPYGAGFKQVIISQGSRAGCDYQNFNSNYCATSCNDDELVVQNVDQYGQRWHCSISGAECAMDLNCGSGGGTCRNDTASKKYPRLYHSCTTFQSFREQTPSPLDFYYQNAVNCSENATFQHHGNNDSAHAPPCVLHYPNEWLTFRIRVTLGASDGDSYPNSIVQMWVARENQAAGTLIIDNTEAGNVTVTDLRALNVFRSKTPADTSPAKYGKIVLTGYHSSKGGACSGGTSAGSGCNSADDCPGGSCVAQQHPAGLTWYDSLVISQNTPPAWPAASSPTAPAAPGNLRAD